MPIMNACLAAGLGEIMKLRCFLSVALTAPGEVCHFCHINYAIGLEKGESFGRRQRHTKTGHHILILKKLTASPYFLVWPFS